MGKSALNVGHESQVLHGSLNTWIGNSRIFAKGRTPRQSLTAAFGDNGT